MAICSVGLEQKCVGLCMGYGILISHKVVFVSINFIT